jgi:hypothetical protein
VIVVAGVVVSVVRARDVHATADALLAVSRARVRPLAARTAPLDRRYVGTEVEELEDEEFEEQLAAAHIELRKLDARARELHVAVDDVLTQLQST